MQKPQEDYEPSWLIEENDVKHREETAPLLFGDGAIDLQDPPPSDEDDVEEEGAEAPQKVPRKGKSKGSSGYGSLISNRDRTDGVDDDHEDVNQSNVTVPPGSDEDATKQQGKPKTASISAVALAKSKGKKKLATASKQKQPPTPRTAAALRAKPHVPGVNPCLWLFHTLQGIGVLASLMLCVTQMIPIVFARGDVLERVGPASVALKAYISSFCVVFVAVETDLPVPFLRDSNLFQRYFSRGFLYSFLGLICLEEAYSERVRDIVRKNQSAVDSVGWAPIFMQLSSWLMLAVGCVYMLMGLCCLKRLRDRLKEKEQQEWKEYREAIKRWKDVYTSS
jgi:hypothetical protein